MKRSRQKMPPTASAELRIETPLDVEGDQIEFGATLVDADQPAQRIWFRFPRSIASLLTRRADPFVIATAVHALHRFRRLHIHGVVSDGLLANLTAFHGAFAAFHHLPAGASVEYTATTIAEPAGPARRSMGISAFSGGVDSCFSVYAHTSLSSLEPKRRTGAALMMHGFDIPLDQNDTFASSVARSKRLTDDAGLRLFTGVTNLRMLSVPWEQTFAAAVAGSLSFFQPAYTFGLVPSCQEWTQVRLDNGSNPLTDPLLSSGSFQIVHDGTSFGRIEKLRHLARWPAALRNMRVCWQGDQLDRNCCRCEKCLRTMLMLDVCGKLPVEAFPLPIEVGAVAALSLKSQGALDEFAYVLREAQRLGLQKPWMHPAARMIAKSERHRRLWQQGKSIAQFVPGPVRSVLRLAGNRWLRRSASARPLVAVERGAGVLR